MRHKERKMIRSRLREKKINCSRTLFGAKRRARKLFRQTGNIYYVFAEAYGFVITDLAGVDLFNQARKKNSIRKLRGRDLNKISVYRFPKKAWIVLKNEKANSK